jgi:hypothetical protein
MIVPILLVMLLLSIFGIGWCVWLDDFAFAISFTIVALGVIKEIINQHNKGD